MSCSFLYLHFKHSLGKQMQGKYLLNEWMNEILRWESLLGKKLFKDPTTWSPLQLSNNRSFRRLPCPVPDIRPGKATEDLVNPATQYGSQHPCWFQGGIRPKSLNLNPRTHFCPNLLFKGFEILSGHYFFFFLATLRRMRDLSSQTRDTTRASCSGSSESTTGWPGKSLSGHSKHNS